MPPSDRFLRHHTASAGCMRGLSAASQHSPLSCCPERETLRTEDASEGAGPATHVPWWQQRRRRWGRRRRRQPWPHRPQYNGRGRQRGQLQRRDRRHGPRHGPQDHRLRGRRRVRQMQLVGPGQPSPQIQEENRRSFREFPAPRHDLLRGPSEVDRPSGTVFRRLRVRARRSRRPRVPRPCGPLCRASFPFLFQLQLPEHRSARI